MHGFRRLVLVVSTLLFSAAAAGGSSKHAGQLKTLKVPLSQRKLRKGAFRLGWNAKGEIPENCLVARLGKKTFYFFDLNGDDKLTADGKDGLALQGKPFVVHFGDNLLLPLGQFNVAFDTKKIILTPEDLGIDAKLLRDAAELTNIRVAAGLAPVMIDKSACQHCELHCDYLHRNRDQQGMDLHKEYPNRPGYTPEGARAGKSSNMGPSVTSYRLALRSWYRTAWHGAPIVDPSLRAVGVMLKHNTAMLYFADRGGAHSELFVHPADGASDIPCGFSSRGERPNPVPRTNYGRGSGFPVFVRLTRDLRSRKVLEASLEPVLVRRGKIRSGKKVMGTVSSPLQPANPQWPSNSSLALFIPTRPLSRQTAYQARFVIDGLEKPIKWVFHTGKGH